MCFTLFNAFFVPAFIWWKNKSYCDTKSTLLGSGGQSKIYLCGDDTIKQYKRPWIIDMDEMEAKLKALNQLEFVPETKQFYPTVKSNILSVVRSPKMSPSC